MCTDVCLVSLQALPGSRLDTSLLKEWLLQHLDSLHTYQSHVAAAEAASRQKQHAAAAAAAVRAVQTCLEAIFQEDGRDDSSSEGSPAAEPALMGLAQHGAMELMMPAQLVDAAAGAANKNAAGVVPTHDKPQVRRTYNLL